MPFKMVPGYAVPTTWQAGRDPEGERHGEPELISKAVAQRAFYTGREGSIEGYEGSFIYFKDPTTGQCYAQRRPIEDMLAGLEEWKQKHKEWGQNCGGFYGKCCKSNAKRKEELSKLVRRIKSGKPYG